ncbi:hypothetical protein ACH4NO_17965 [Streptomyces olivaceus]|uniref:hypothetical protein n=1 Tax=Streptomyces olivaceus TaxID=47716 RepID=UPI0004C4AFE6|nr:hypothetical protein [Streptomyces olivaceus]MBZ6102693.1 hypothetical protein [Streptomyces olivaceus]
MAQYTINYMTGDEEIVHAAKVDKSIDGDDYRFHDANGRVVAYVPSGNVLSIVLVDEPQAVTD